MKVLVGALFVLLAVSAFAEEANWDIDWSTVVPRTEVPGFWDGRDIKPAFYPGSRNGRIVGGQVVAPHTHPYQVGLLLRINIFATGLCGGSVLTTRAILTAAHCPVSFSSKKLFSGFISNY